MLTPADPAYLLAAHLRGFDLVVHLANGLRVILTAEDR